MDAYMVYVSVHGSWLILHGAFWPCLWMISNINYNKLCELGRALGVLKAKFEYLNIYHVYGHGHGQPLWAIQFSYF